MNELLENIKVVPIAEVPLHEGVVENNILRHYPESVLVFTA